MEGTSFVQHHAGVHSALPRWVLGNTRLEGIKRKEQSSPSLQLNFKMLKLSFLMEMENYCCEMLGIAACACLCLAEHGGKVFFAFSLNTELANGELGKDFVYLDSETWILTPSSGVCALFLRRTCFGSLQRLFCNSILHLRCLGRELKPSECF